MPVAPMVNEQDRFAAIEAALSHPGRQIPMPCEELPTHLLGGHLTWIYADKFGRLWVWWQDEKMLRMIFDPREARG